MAIVGTIIRPEQTPIIEEFRASTGEIPLTQNYQDTYLYVPDLNRPVSDVTITVRCRLNMFAGVPVLNGINLKIAGQEVEPRWTPVGEPVYCNDISEAVWTLSVAQWWEDLIAGQNAVTIRAHSEGYIHLTDHPCAGPFLSIDVGYLQSRTDPYEILPTWHVGLATMHKTLVASRWEERGVPHYHEADFAIDRRTGKLVVISKSAGVSHQADSDMVTRSGFGVAQADAEGNQIPTHGLPGTFQSLTVGRLKGSVVRFAADGECIPL